MAKLSVLDVLIVYNGATVASPTDKFSLPFPPDSLNAPCNTAYAYFLEICAKNNLTAGFASSTDIIGSGRVQAYWTFVDGTWRKVLSGAKTKLVFDKFSPKSAANKKLRNLLFSNKLIKPYNLPTTYNTFFDKQKTANKHSSLAIPTVSLADSKLTSINLALSKLAKQASKRSSQDFSQALILKDRFGAGGWHVYKISYDNTKQIQKIMRENPKISFILQPFANFNGIDTRLVYHAGQIVQSYVRQAKAGDFRCNEHQCATSRYLTLAQIPPTIRSHANSIAKSIIHDQSLFALDFVTCQSGNSYFLEGNTGPGLSWNDNIPHEVMMCQKLIRTIVKGLQSRLLNLPYGTLDSRHHRYHEQPRPAQNYPYPL